MHFTQKLPGTARQKGKTNVVEEDVSKSQQRASLTQWFRRSRRDEIDHHCNSNDSGVAGGIYRSGDYRSQKAYVWQDSMGSEQNKPENAH